MEKTIKKCKNNNKILKNKKDNMLKYRCEKCDSILFESDDISGTIKIVCKAKVSGNKDNRSRKCRYTNIIKEGKNV